MTAAWSFHDNRKWTWLFGPWRFVFCPLWLRRAVSADVLGCFFLLFLPLFTRLSAFLWQCSLQIKSRCWFLWDFIGASHLCGRVLVHSSLQLQVIEARSIHAQLSDLWFLWLVQVQLCKPKSSCLAALPTRLYFSCHLCLGRGSSCEPRVPHSQQSGAAICPWVPALTRGLRQYDMLQTPSSSPNLLDWLLSMWSSGSGWSSSP